MYLKRLLLGFTVCWENVEEMHDVEEAIARLRAKWPSGYTAPANEYIPTPEEVAAMLARPERIPERAQQEAVQCHGVSPAETHPTGSVRKSDRDSRQSERASGAPAESLSIGVNPQQPKADCPNE